MKAETDALHRVASLKYNMDYSAASRWRIRAILNGGPGATQALLQGHRGSQQVDLEDELPWANLIHSGITRLAQKLGRVPGVRVAPPHDTNNEAPQKRAEKRERIVQAYDDYDRMELQLPQVARWLPGYGFAVWTISSQTSADGYVYPCAQLRDPYGCYPGEWGVRQQPEELAVCRRIPPKEAQRLYPSHAALIERATSSRGQGGMILGSSNWDNPRGRGLEVIEYYDSEGCHVLIPQIERRVDYHPNPLSTPAFVVAKRISFDQLIGQYDHAFGLMAASAKLNSLYITALEDNVFAPTNVAGDMDGPYRVGRLAVNRLAPGTTVSRPQTNIPYQASEWSNRLEREIRTVTGYSVQDDGDSPLNYSTGAGLEELQQGAGLEVREYQKVLEYAFRDLDAKRLEWDEMVSGDQKKPLAGRREGGRGQETYIPTRDIDGEYRTNREFGWLSDLDDPAKIVAGGQLLSMRLMDRLTFQQMIDGLRDITEINERIHDEDMEQIIIQGLMAAAQQGDQRALMLAVDELPEGPRKSMYQKWLTPEGEALSPEQEAMAGLGAPPVEGPPPDITTLLSQLPSSGEPRSGLQTVSRVA